MVFDAFAGIDSYESKNHNGDKFLNISDKFFKKFNFNVYNKAETISTVTSTSFVNLTNFTTDIRYSHQHNEYRDSLNNNDYYLKSDNYFQVWKQVKNLFFEQFNQISVHQSWATNFCELNEVYKCDTFNPFTQRDFIDGFKNTMLSRIISINQLNGSISGYLILRVMRQFRLIDSLGIPESERPALPQTLNKIEKDIYSQKYDLIFVHSLIPHLPFGYNTKCKYDGSLSINHPLWMIRK